MWFGQRHIRRIGYVTLLTSALTLADVLDGYGLKRVLLETQQTIDRFLEAHNLQVRLAMFYSVQDGPTTKCRPVEADAPAPSPLHAVALRLSNDKLQWVYPYRATVVATPASVPAMAEAYVALQLHRVRHVASAVPIPETELAPVAANEVGHIWLPNLYLQLSPIDVCVRSIQDSLSQALWHPSRFDEGPFLSILRWTSAWWPSILPDSSRAVPSAQLHRVLSSMRPPTCFLFWQSHLLEALETWTAPMTSLDDVAMLLRQIHARHWMLPEVYRLFSQWHTVYPRSTLSSFKSFAAFVKNQLHPAATECTPTIVAQWLLQQRQYVHTLPYNRLESDDLKHCPSILHV